MVGKAVDSLEPGTHGVTFVVDDASDKEAVHLLESHAALFEIRRDGPICRHRRRTEKSCQGASCVQAEGRSLRSES